MTFIGQDQKDVQKHYTKNITYAVKIVQNGLNSKKAAVEIG
jgi:hypothetical protein